MRTMEIDEELSTRMRRILSREAEIARERREVQVAAQQDLVQLDARIEEERAKLDELEAKREELARFIGLPSSADQARMAHGALKELCFEALKGASEGLRSAEIKDWIERSHPGTRTASVPATLSRQVEYGTLVRDELGRYRLK